MEKAFTRINWENTPSMATPLNEDNLNEGDAALDVIDDRVISLDLTKANQSDLLQTVKTITYNTTTGVFVFTWWNGTTLNVDLNIEKIPVSFSMDANGVITMTTSDGSTYTADVGSLITQYSFVDSSEIDFTVTVDAQTGDSSVTAGIKDGSITGAKLQPNYLADVTTQAQQASSSASSASGSATNAHNDALLAQSYAIGTGGTVRTGDATDNSKYYKEQAQQAAADAQAAAHVSTMTLSTNGIGRPDGTTITVDANGVFTATSGQVFIYPDPNVLPSASTANENAIYLIDDPTASGSDICTEWVVVTTNNVKTWKQIGDTSVDLSGYATTTQLNTKVNKTDMASIEATGTTNTTGSTIEEGTYFWLNGSFVKAKTDIAINATFTANTNYETVDDVLNTFEGGGSGIPSGGTTGQVLAKHSNTDGDVEWKDVGGGSANIQEVAYATFDQKSQAEKDNGTAWFIPDVPVMPNGRTATPNDVQTWLACANITDKAYTTVSQVLSDTTTLTALINDNNASDYMARSITWATTICANQTAMTLIGANNYCADAVLANSTWLEAVTNSTYIESVLNVKVPTMTSNTTPSGEVLHSRMYGDDSASAYRVFDNDLTTSAGLDAFNNVSDNYFGYDFTTSKVVKCVKVTQLIEGNKCYFYSWKFEGSNDASTWTQLDEVTANTSGVVIRTFTNATAFRYYRCHLIRTNIAYRDYYGNAKELQFYGREDV